MLHDTSERGCTSDLSVTINTALAERRGVQGWYVMVQGWEEEEGDEG